MAIAAIIMRSGRSSPLPPWLRRASRRCGLAGPWSRSRSFCTAPASAWRASQGKRAARDFGPDRYPIIMGRIAMPSLIAQAAAPSIGAILLEAGGPNGALAVFLATAGCNVVLVSGLFLMLRYRGEIVRPVRMSSPFEPRRRVRPYTGDNPARERVPDRRSGRAHTFIVAQLTGSFARTRR